jgi:hypothetical protein
MQRSAIGRMAVYEMHHGCVSAANGGQTYDSGPVTTWLRCVWLTKRCECVVSGHHHRVCYNPVPWNWYKDKNYKYASEIAKDLPANPV